MNCEALQFDAVVIGAGAAGLFCAGVAGQLGARVLLVDHAQKVAEKIRISGGGRCNFTNLDVGPANFLSGNPHFCRSALARYCPKDFIDLVNAHGIAWHEKHRGQLFCNDSAQSIIDMLLAECAKGGVTHWQPCAVQAVRKSGEAFELDTDRGTVTAARVVIATGGLSIPKIGATDFGYRIAKQFGLKLIEPRPALVPLTFDAQIWAPFIPLAGLSLEVAIECDSGGAFTEDLLFTHRGLSGPAVLQISSYWTQNSGTQNSSIQNTGRQNGARSDALTLNLAPTQDLAARFKQEKQQSRKQLKSVLDALLPHRLAEAAAGTLVPAAHRVQLAKPLPEVPDKALADVAQALTAWRITPNGTEGYKKAEVTIGGVDTRELSSQTMQASKVPGLYFIGEVVDVTGWLGGYNFQWAWASGYACAQALTMKS
jgi:predicted Rossmann fold flavoprotein